MARHGVQAQPPRRPARAARPRHPPNTPADAVVAAPVVQVEELEDQAEPDDADLAAASPAELLNIAHAQRTTIAQYRNKCHIRRQTTRRLHQVVQAAEQRTADAQAAIARITFTHTPKRIQTKQCLRGFTRDSLQQSSRLSLLGGYRLAMKRCLGHSSLKDTLEQMEVTSTRQTFAAWELRLSASLILASRDFYKESDAAIRAYHQQVHQQLPATSASDDPGRTDTVLS